VFSSFIAFPYLCPFLSLLCPFVLPISFYPFCIIHSFLYPFASLLFGSFSWLFLLIVLLSQLFFKISLLPGNFHQVDTILYFTNIFIQIIFLPAHGAFPSVDSACNSGKSE